MPGYLVTYLPLYWPLEKKKIKKLKKKSGDKFWFTKGNELQEARRSKHLSFWGMKVHSDLL